MLFVGLFGFGPWYFRVVFTLVQFDLVGRFLCVLIAEKVYKTGLADELTGADGSALDTR